MYCALSARLQADLRRRCRDEPYELIQRGGSVEHFNEEPGALWLQRIPQIYSHAVWLNPLPSASGRTTTRYR